MSIQFISVAQSCLTLCDTIDCSMPGFPVHYQLQECSQNSYPSSGWCHPTISSSVITFSSCLQSFPALGSFPMSRFFILGGQKYWSCSFSISPSNECSRLISFRIDWIDLSQSKGLSRVFSNTTVQKHQFSSALSFLYSPTLTSIHDYWKNHSFN